MACPDFRSRLVLGVSGLQRKSLCDSYLPRTGRMKDYSLLIPSQSRVLCREKYFFSKFLEGSIHCLKRFWVRVLVFSAEQASQRSSTSLQLYHCMLEVGFI